MCGQSPFAHFKIINGGIKNHAFCFYFPTVNLDFIAASKTMRAAFARSLTRT